MVLQMGVSPGVSVCAAAARTRRIAPFLPADGAEGLSAPFGECAARRTGEHDVLGPVDRLPEFELIIGVLGRQMHKCIPGCSKGVERLSLRAGQSISQRDPFR